jgi:hypothetical protein
MRRRARVKALIPVMWLVNGFVGGFLWATFGATSGNIGWLVTETLLVTLAGVMVVVEGCE